MFSVHVSQRHQKNSHKCTHYQLTIDRFHPIADEEKILDM